MVYLLNRNSGQHLEMGHSVPNGKWEFPKTESLESSGFAKKGQIVELVSVTPAIERYFGIEYRKDFFRILARGQLTESGITKLDG